ncbi:hypothetical protein PAMC26577_39605 [Caballeronia sordidicola]|uniref:Uncharacterized protein n=1 Tax=Caballeronia sordidicola TaxID=196367 RepID=A0A242M2L1_CABSO|nr:hypothetical protein PAMC26577_39605 [Caballeronia sordidicola]
MRMSVRSQVVVSMSWQCVRLQCANHRMNDGQFMTTQA